MIQYVYIYARGTWSKKTLELQKTCVKLKTRDMPKNAPNVRKMSKYHLLPHTPAASFGVKKQSLRIFEVRIVIVNCWEAWISQQNKGVTKHWWGQNLWAKSPHDQKLKKGPIWKRKW